MQNTPIADRHALLPTMAAGKNFLLAAARRCGKTKDFRVNRCTLSFLIVDRRFRGGSYDLFGARQERSVSWWHRLHMAHSNELVYEGGKRASRAAGSSEV